jgi:ATP-dependent DNA helicase RecG
MAQRIKPGMRVRVQGMLKRRGPQIQIVNPKVEFLDPGNTDTPELASREAGLRPIYPAAEAINSAAIERVIRHALPMALPLIEDHLTEAYRAARELPTLAEAYRMQHTPTSDDETARSRRRLAYDELLQLQLGVHLKRAHLRETLRAPALAWSPEVDRRIRERFPFALTPGQEEAVRAIASDLSKGVPANRLIQGDVGSGKTIVALYAMLMAVASQKQAALMAPTELLAEQHHASLSRLLQGSKVRVELLVGGLPQAQRDSILTRLASGDIDILIGTHALLTESVRFADLAVAIIDEQHRFGVHQRATLREKATDATSTPHVLVMTATPIPRTVAITLFGDLDVSTIKGLPPGRRTVRTAVLPFAHARDAYADLFSRLAAGEQAYIVVPAIEAGLTAPAADSAAEPLRDVRTVLRDLELGPLKGFHLAALHGQLSRASRETIMERFRLRQIDAIVATTVIEVGVDVPNATAMVVEQADRFGLAQLHQLRGRVGRGEKPSVCYLIADPKTPDGEARLRVMETISDGFALAEKDFEIRGPGEVLGLKQSGLPPFKVADLVRDRALLEMARRDAAEWVARSPALAWPEEALIKRRLLKAFGEALGLADVG